jgi:hypothetical protein
MMKRLFLFLSVSLIALLLVTGARAHKPSDSYLALALDERSISGQWDIALRDLDHAIGLDVNGDRAITWGEVRSKHDDIEAYALARLELTVPNGACTINAADHLINEHSDGRYASMILSGHCPSPIDSLVLDYQLMFDLDSLHRGLLSVEAAGVTQTHLLSPDHNRLVLDMQAPGLMGQAIGYLKSGIWHIWIGIDHILFLVTLLFGSFVRRSNGAWRIAPSLRGSLFDVLGIVTAFTLAHSITLTLATLKLVNLPSAPIEALIAASIIIAALNNLYPVITRRIWLLALVFGLIHGFGFAGALSDFGLPSSALALALLSFNLGVEVGQIVIVGVFVLIVLAVRPIKRNYSPLATCSQVAVAAIGAFWVVERLGAF